MERKNDGWITKQRRITEAKKENPYRNGDY